MWSKYTHNPHSLVSAEQDAVLRRFRRLRDKAFAFDSAIGAQFARDAARGWKTKRFRGICEAAWTLHYTTANLVGAWDVYTGASQLAMDCERLVDREKWPHEKGKGY